MELNEIQNQVLKTKTQNSIQSPSYLCDSEIHHYTSPLSRWPFVPRNIMAITHKSLTVYETENYIL